MVWRLGLAPLEETLFDRRAGRAFNRNLVKYHVRLNADIGNIDVSVVDEDDPHVNALGAQGVMQEGAP
jgi:xanthine dehydrogenase YagR molybdenum-binding subunit